MLRVMCNAPKTGYTRREPNIFPIEPKMYISKKSSIRLDVSLMALAVSVAIGGTLYNLNSDNKPPPGSSLEELVRDINKK